MNENLTLFNQITDNIEKVIVGKRSAIELCLTALLCDGHVLIEDVPGVGKTSMVYSIAKSLNLSFKRIQFTPDILPSDITGFSMYNQKSGKFDYKPGIVLNNIILADEINRTSPKTQASLLEVMEEKQVTVDGETYKVPVPFMVLATQNPVEYLGTYPLPEAQLDRFTIKVSMGYPSMENESVMLERFKLINPLDTLESVADGEFILKLQTEVRKIHVEDRVKKYIVEISDRTRKHEAVSLGASPRASIDLYRASQARAFCQDRNYITPDDVKFMAAPVLSHRIFLRQEAKLKKVSAEQIIREILVNIRVPA